MKLLRRVLLLVLALSLVCQAGMAASLLDGTWKGTFTSKGAGAKASGRAVTAYVKGGDFRVVSKAKSQIGTFGYDEKDGSIWAMITLDGQTRKVPGTYSFKGKTLTIKLSYETIGGKKYSATIKGKIALPKATGLTIKSKKADATSNASMKMNAVAEYAVLTDNADKVLGIADKGAKVPYTWVKGKNYFRVYAGCKDVKGAIPIAAKVGDTLSEADKNLLSPAKAFTKKSK